jgi:hypothetical protein
LIPDWTYEKLLATADLVVIAEPLTTRDTKDALEWPGHKPTDFIGQDTEFQVRHVLKGNLKIAKFSMLHFRHSGRVMESNGATFVRFQLQERVFTGDIRDGDEVSKGSVAEGKPDYLLFLKLRPDGRYEAVSGQYDSALSCRKILATENDR